MTLKRSSNDCKQERQTARPSPEQPIETDCERPNTSTSNTEKEEQWKLTESKAVAIPTGLQTDLSHIFNNLKPFLEKIPQAVKKISDWQQRIALDIVPAIEKIAAVSQQFPRRIQTALTVLGHHGWYLDGELGMTTLWHIESLLASGNGSEVDYMLVEHYENRLTSIEDSLVSSLPLRAKILQAAFNAHRRKEYELSVPVFLAQSDGTCLDLTGCPLFMKDRTTGLPQVAGHIQAAGDAIASAFLSPLTTALPIYASERERRRILIAKDEMSWRELNRHTVLHGEACDYATQINSLKAISLLNYLAEFLTKFQSNSDN